MMRCSRQRVQQERQQLSMTSRRHDFLQKVRVAFEELEAMLPGSFDFVKIGGDFTWGRQSFGQRPFERIVPEVSCNAAKRLLDRRRATQNLLTTGMKRQGIRCPGWLVVEQLGRDRFDQFVRIAMELSKLPVETRDEFVH